MFNEFEKEDDQWRPEQPKAWKIAKKSIGWAFSALVILIIGFLVARVALSQPPSSMEEIVWNQKLLDTHAGAKADGRKLEILKIPASNSFSEDGFYSLYEIAYIPEASQLQFTVRHNDRALNYLREDEPGIADLEKNGQEIYTYTLIVSKAEESTSITSYSYTKAARFGYTFRRLIFEGVDLTGVTSVKLHISCSTRPAAAIQSINVYSNTDFGSIKSLPDFPYDVPKKATSGIKQREL